MRRRARAAQWRPWSGVAVSGCASLLCPLGAVDATVTEVPSPPWSNQLLLAPVTLSVRVKTAPLHSSVAALLMVTGKLFDAEVAPAAIRSETVTGLPVTTLGTQPV